MKSDFKKLPGSIVELEVVLDHKEFLEYYQPVYDQALSAVNLKGFRPGAAPKELATKAVDLEKVFEEAVNRAVRDNLQEIAKENNWQAIDRPKIEVLEETKNLGGLKFKATLTIFPEVKLGNYRKIAKEILNTKKEIAVADKEIEDSLKWVLNSRAKTVRVSRPAEKGDVVEIDYSGSVDGKILDRMAGQGDKFILGEGKFIPGFEENILNRKEGEVVEFSVTFPKDYWEESLREKKADFKVTVKAVFARELPELNDEFVKGLGKFATVEEFKNSVREGLQKEKSDKEKEKLRLKILDEIRKDSEFDLPQVMVDRTLENMVAEYEQMAGPQKDSQATREKFRTNAENSVKNNLILYQIAKDEQLEPQEKEVEAEANQFLERSGFNKQRAEGKIDPQRLYDYIYGIVQNKKVFEFLEALK